MRKFLAAVVLLAACATIPAIDKSGVVVIHAQTLPVTKTLLWDPVPDPCAPATTCPVLNYTVTLDGTVIGSPTTTSQAVTFTTAGTHNLTVTATNIWGTSPAGALTVNLVVPGKPANLKVQ